MLIENTWWLAWWSPIASFSYAIDVSLVHSIWPYVRSQQVVKIIEGNLNFLPLVSCKLHMTSCLYSQIWLNLLMDDQHFNYITRLEKREKKHCQEVCMMWGTILNHVCCMEWAIKTTAKCQLAFRSRFTTIYTKIHGQHQLQLTTWHSCP
jgi:hypothetical protein